MKRLSPLIAAAAVVLVLVAVGAVLLTRSSGRTVTAYFSRTIGLYTGSSVRVLGVPVGKVTSITSEDTRVKVVMTYDSRYKLPADAKAVVVPPSIVADRYVQFTPAYSGGPVLPDGAVIPEQRTAVPAELDEIFGNLNQLNVALGPKGANKNGALSRLINVGARNLDGNGAALKTALTDFSQAVGTLNGNRGDLFGTLRNLQQFTDTLANNDGGVRRVNADLAQVAVQLDNERTELAAALKNLGIALGQVAGFVRDNRAALKADVADAGTVTNALLKEKRALVEFLDEAPLALQNLALAYDPATQTLRTRNKPATQNPGSPLQPLCDLLAALGQKCPAAPPLPIPSPGAPPASQSLRDLLAGGLQ